ncbi:hypothetical protein K2173_011994 [Erythroxylum novogranatense]|uniref:DUF668 family protein n=1 Tax=Erythroxylum novogranatense TaxID=1862640 RepID=A0AAV8TEK8_9ROSI|nr:hypothetical protein K2173_011994 [Erythroxylum novogranatense]
MGGLCSCSKNLEGSKRPLNNPYNKAEATSTSSTNLFDSKVASSGSNRLDTKKFEEKEKLISYDNKNEAAAVIVDDDLNDDFSYDGIPRYSSLKSRSARSRQAAVTKVSSVSSRLGRAGLEKAVEVLDTLGSSMTNLNSNSGFASSVATKGNELTILAFEVANTVVKGSNIMQSLSKERIRHLKDNVFSSEGVQSLISNDTDELLRVVAVDQREELKIFVGEVVRFGNRCKDPQWHNLDRYFEKLSRELTPQKHLREESEAVIELLMTFVHSTAELYHELQVLDRLEQDCQHKSQESSLAATQIGQNLASLRAELKSQRKQLRNLKKRSLWSRSLEEVMEKLVDIVHFLLLEIHDTFGKVDGHVTFQGSESNRQRLGPAGLSLHYANIIMQIDNLVVRSSSIPQNMRDQLYQGLPPSIKSALRSKLQSHRVKEELTITEIKDEMEKTLQWLVPMSTNTAKAHHGFGWVGEWANTGSDVNRRAATTPAQIIRIETLHHADKEKTEAYILDLLLWLHHLVRKSKTSANGEVKTATKAPFSTNPEKLEQKKTVESTLILTSEEQKMLEDVKRKRRTLGMSKSGDFDMEKNRKLRKHDRLSKSTSHLNKKQNKEAAAVKRLHSVVPIISFGVEKEKALDIIDRVDMFR